MYGQPVPQYFDQNPYNQPQGTPYNPQYQAYPPPPPPPPPPPQYSGGQPTVIRINNNNSGGSFCPNCQSNTPSFAKKTIGIGNFIWCFICCCFIGPFALIVLCMDQFGDTEMRCAKCTGVKESHGGIDF